MKLSIDRQDLLDINQSVGVIIANLLKIYQEIDKDDKITIIRELTVIHQQIKSLVATLDKVCDDNEKH